MGQTDRMRAEQCQKSRAKAREVSSVAALAAGGLSILAVVGTDGRQWRQYGCPVVGHSRRRRRRRSYGHQTAASQCPSVQRHAGRHRSQVYRRPRQVAGRRKHGKRPLLSVSVQWRFQGSLRGGVAQWVYHPSYCASGRVSRLTA